MALRALAVCLLLGLVTAHKHDIYTGFSVHKIALADQAEQSLLHSLVEPLELDTWQHGVAGRRDAIIMVKPEHKLRLIEELETAGVKHVLVSDNVAESLKKQDAERMQWKQSRMATGARISPFEDYPRYDEVTEYLEYLAATYPNEVTLVNAGPSFEGRDVLYLKVSSSNFEDDSKPIYFLDAMMHAREWVTTPVALYVLHQLLEVRADGEEDLLAETDWIVLPVVNPDGYEFTHTNDRMWRKTRSTTTGLCRGVDANRNFNYNFNTYGVFGFTCSELYPGPAPFSEVETQYIRDIILENVDRMQVYLNIHSYGNYMLYGFDDVIAPNTPQLHHMAAAMGAAMDAVKLPNAQYYLVGNGGMVLYPASGNAQDWAQSVGATFAFTPELPGYDNYMFEVPPTYINHINDETWQGIKAMARIARLHYAADRS